MAQHVRFEILSRTLIRDFHIVTVNFTMQPLTYEQAKNPDCGWKTVIRKNDYKSESADIFVSLERVYSSELEALEGHKIICRLVELLTRRYP